MKNSNIKPLMDSKKKFFLGITLILICSLVFSFYIHVYLQIPSFTINQHSVKFYTLKFILFFLIFFPVFLLFWFSYSRLLALFSEFEFKELLFKNSFYYLPVFFLLLFPAALKYYLTREDLQKRLKLFLIIVIFSILYLKLIQLTSLLKGKIKITFATLSLKKRIFTLFFISWGIYLICAGIMVSKGIYFSGDEPHYLLITHSLIKDKDINLANNYRDKDYSTYMPSNINLRPHGRFGKKGRNFIYSFHLPGISVLILPFYIFGLILKGKFLFFFLRGGVGILGSLLGVQIYLFFQEHWNDEKKSLIVWALYSFTVPILFYSIHIYPEIAIALFSLYIFRKIYSKEKISSLSLFLLGGLLSTFLWFGVKYHFLFSLMLLVSCYFLLKKHRIKFKIIYFLVFPLISYLLFSWFLYTLYGTFTSLSVYEGVVTKEYVKYYYKFILTELPFSKRVESFFNYFFDQRDGLLLYSPVYFFSFIGLIELFKRKKILAFSLIIISLPYILGYAFLTQRGGYAPQARPLIPVFWVFGIFLGSFLIYNKKKFFTFLFLFLALLSIVVVFYLLNDPLSLYQPTTHEIKVREGRLFSNFNNLYFSLTSYLPSYIKIDNSKYLPNYIWFAVFIGFISVYFILKESFFKEKLFYLHCITINLIVFFFFLTKVLFPQFYLQKNQVIEYPKGRKIAFYSLSREAKFTPPYSFLLHREGKFIFIFSSLAPIEKIEFSFGSKAGDFQSKLSIFDIPIYEGLLEKEEKRLISYKIPIYKYRHLYLYLVNINIKKLSPESIRRNPFYFHLLPLDK